MAKKEKKSDTDTPIEEVTTDIEGIEENAADLKKTKVQETMSKKLEKKILKLQDYKAKHKFPELKYKPTDWIDMSPAFKEVTSLNGLPQGHIIMCYGRPDTGKSTMAMEAAAFAQKQGIIPVFIITENKFSFERAENMGINFEEAIVHNGVQTIEEGCLAIKQILDSQEKGELPYDVIFIWDSVGSTPSKAELAKRESEDLGGGMMVTARVIAEQIGRYIGHRINGTRMENYPYNATLFVVNQAYVAPPNPPATVSSIKPKGGESFGYTATLIFRIGGVLSNSSKVTATKDGVQVGFAIKSALIVDKNHLTNITPKGTIICTDHGFIRDDKESIEEYKKQTKDGWNLSYDKNWNYVSED